ncbi:ATP-binding protein [Sandaracinus amylolyticus]|uniref:ATP-binding protein n=1 Tax=Sandaracinus amylolyticus TaxID=927083 RepID=UPI001F39F456|nr:ATP-binding protein [Sandaracinus amylolyticus]UJR82485.1 Hypothetical protein I5071_45500 [Sandaracinus amylolyticus]
MRSLSARVFVAMILANALAMLGVGAVYGARFERRREHQSFLVGELLVRRGADAAIAIGAGDRARAEELLAQAASRSGIGAAILDPEGRVVAGRRDAPQGPELVRTARASREPSIATRGDVAWHVAALPGGFVVVGAPSEPRAIAGLSPPTLQLLLVGLLSAILTLALARWIASPIRALRAATDRLAAGRSGVRVGPTITRTADAEVAALAKDFDRMAERIEALLESRERLLRDVSHELRSPLARLAVALELARQSAGSGAHEALDRIEKEAERLGELVGLVLTMAKLEPSAAPHRSEPVRLDELLQEIHRDAAFEARGAGRDVALVRSAPVEVRGDEEILRQAIENVVRNAIRFTAEGTSVDLALDVSSGRARLEVRDHGPGVPEDALDEIFRPFTRVESARERASGGAGVGLAITDRAVRLHGGAVQAKNAQGGGLVVTIDLPI